jgi:hypothetical protein
MGVQEQILQNVKKMTDPVLLNQLHSYIRLMNRTVSVAPQGNVSAILKYLGRITDEEAQEISACIDAEFSNIEEK